MKPQGLPRGKAAYAGKPQEVPRGNPWGKPGFPSPTGRVLRLDFPKETPGFSLPPATFPAPFWARLRFPRGFLGEKQDNWSSPGETLEHRLSPGAPFWVRLRFPRGFPGGKQDNWSSPGETLGHRLSPGDILVGRLPALRACFLYHFPLFLPPQLLLPVSIGECHSRCFLRGGRCCRRPVSAACTGSTAARCWLARIAA